MLSDKINVKGSVNLKLYNRYGELIENNTVNNLVVDAGKHYIASRIAGVTPTVMTHMALGLSSVAPIYSHTTLLSQISSTATSLYSTTPVVVNSTVTYICNFLPNVPSILSQPIVEAGIFNAVSAGIMLCRVVFPVINKAAEDTLIVTWDVTII
jgi:hypothetical protein